MQAALHVLGLSMPPKKVTVSLAPALDLTIAI